eukprot:comp22807_c0_seq1/m.35786 comp22807_c0_seq1/g.35786  ORF comp22807_c0_seq1/g.35786 comp22807_c0_seq1/m.35786 type:complete len:301 (-) comp22807_c0_seq1:782-1684(-)
MLSWASRWRATTAGVGLAYTLTAPARRHYGVLSRPVGKTLEFDKYLPRGGEKGCPVVIAHGLFGNKGNWRGVARRLAQDTHRTVYCVDLRNHGTSPHSPLMTYDAMVADLRLFVRDHHLKDIVLLGHSMGAKAVMSYALDDPTGVNRLIIEDMSPVAYEDFTSITSIVDALVCLELSSLKTKSDAERYMKKTIPDIDEGTVKFLSTNLINEGGSFKWRCNLAAIARSINSIRVFPQFTEPYMGKTLFIYGTKSPYVAQEHFPLVQKLFPNTTTASLDVGHWLHAEDPNGFIRIVTDFLNH